MIKVHYMLQVSTSHCVGCTRGHGWPRSGPAVQPHLSYLNWICDHDVYTHPKLRLKMRRKRETFRLQQNIVRTASWCQTLHIHHQGQTSTGRNNKQNELFERRGTLKMKRYSLQIWSSSLKAKSSFFRIK